MRYKQTDLRNADGYLNVTCITSGDKLGNYYILRVLVLFVIVNNKYLSDNFLRYCYYVSDYEYHLVIQS